MADVLTPTKYAGGVAVEFVSGGLTVSKITRGPKHGKWVIKVGSTEYIGLTPESTVTLVDCKYPNCIHGIKPGKPCARCASGLRPLADLLGLD